MSLEPESDAPFMQRALDLAVRGRGAVEPNPLVGAVVVTGGEVVGEGWHRQFGGPHAEVEALTVAGARASGATLYVTLEPCCHQGKTPPCSGAIVAAGIRHVVAAMADPFSAVAGGGIAALRAAGIEVDVGLGEAAARELNAPYLKLLATGRPWLIAKWAMSLDGKIATHTGESRWIGGPQARAIVHELRGRVDAIVDGRRTAELDDPLLTARPPGPRLATRIVVDSAASLAPASQLARTARDVPVIVACSADAPAHERDALSSAGCEVLPLAGTTHAARLDELLVELGRRRMTNVLVEGGGQLLGSLFDAGAIDEVHAFVAPLLIGGAAAPSPLAGEGIARLAAAARLVDPAVRPVDDGVYLYGRLQRQS